MGRLDGKVALISGSARGQGEAHARLFVSEGAKVVVSDVLDHLGEKVAADLGGDAVYQHLDVTNEDDWAAAVQRAQDEFGRLNVLVNNAGILKVGTVESTTADDFLAVVGVNQFGFFLGMKAVVPAMRAAGGTIVNISSTSGLEGTPGTIAYSATKWAVRGMTKCAALELGAYGIRVNSVHPGGVDTEMVRIPEFAHIDADTVYGRQPIPRPAQPQEISPVVLFLASDESSFCTGGEFAVDGGMTCGRGLGI